MGTEHRFLLPLIPVGLALSLAASTALNVAEAADGNSPQFQRIATYEVRNNIPGAARTDEHVAEIVAASEDGKTLVYTDSPGESVGFLDISDPAHPVGLGSLMVGGEPTSVAVAGPYALVAVNTSADYVNVSGSLKVYDIATRSLVTMIPLGGQPDSVAVSPDGRYAAVVIENERDEDLTDPSLTPEEGGLPQLPAGYLVIVDLVGVPAQWTTRTVDLTGLADFAPSDPEPEFVDINAQNIAAVTLQENNHIVLVNLPRGRVIRDFNAGAVTLTDVDTKDNDLIELTDTLSNIPREPDAIGWLSNGLFATANEGDLMGGSRGFTIYDRRGQERFDAGNAYDHLAVHLGHYPEGRSDNKGTEPEGIEVGVFNGEKMLFVGSERAGFVGVYRVRLPGRPRLVQVLPTGIGPEGLLAIPQRNLFVAACETDIPPDEADELAGFRSVVSLYRLEDGPATYPTIVSANRPGGDPALPDASSLPIPWAALSALAGDRNVPTTLYTAHDSFFKQSRIYAVDTSQTPAVINGEIVLKTQTGETVNYDVEGLTQRANGGFWVVSEGAGSVDDPGRPVTSFDLLVEVAPDGTVLNEVTLPDAVNALQRRFGYEGVAVTGSGSGEKVYVAFQREWVGDPDGHVRIGEYTPADGSWRFFYYPLETPPAYANAWVGLSELAYLGNDTFAVIERDNAVGEEAEIKRLYTFSIAGLEPKTEEEGGFPLVTKTLARDILPDLKAPNGTVLDKPEGMTVAADGQVYVVTDNDGVDDSPGETQFLRLGDRKDVFGF